VSYAIRRCEFDHWLLSRSGAALATGEPVRRIVRTGGRWVVEGQYAAPVLVGAGGHFCPVSRMLNGPAAGGPMVVARECEFRMTAREAAACAIDGDVPELLFSPDRLGYGWCVRKGAFLNVGFGRIGSESLRESLGELMRVLCGGRGVPEPPRDSWTGHAYRLYARPLRAMVDDGVVLVGDAAGLAHPISGEGIRAAVESGRIAARAILDAGESYARERLEAYATRLHRHFGRPGAAVASYRGVPDALVARLTRDLLAAPWFARHVLLRRWFLHAHQRPLASPARP
jgi:flavin-dependent dehydrogenase